MSKKQRVLIGPTQEAEVSYPDPHGFRWYKLIVTVDPTATPVTGTPLAVAGPGSEAFYTGDDTIYRKFGDAWSVTVP